MSVRLATGRYATFDPSMGVPVGITVGRPKFELGYRVAAEISELAPFGLFRRLDGDEFEAAYRHKLDRIGVDGLRRRFEQIAREHGDPLVLLCFEPVGDPCHRHIAAAWWQEQTGETVPEVGVPALGLQVRTQNAPVQLTLDLEGNAMSDSNQLSEEIEQIQAYLAEHLRAEARRRTAEGPAVPPPAWLDSVAAQVEALPPDDVRLARVADVSIVGTDDPHFDLGPGASGCIRRLGLDPALMTLDQLLEEIAEQDINAAAGTIDAEHMGEGQ